MGIKYIHKIMQAAPLIHFQNFLIILKIFLNNI